MERGVTLVTLSLPKSIQGDLGLLLLHNNQAEVEKAEPQMMAKTKLSSWQIPTDVTEQRKKQEMSGAEDGLMFDANLRPETKLNEQGRAQEVAIEAAVSAIIHLKDSLNEWDSKVGDGDCGATVSLSPHPDFVANNFDMYYLQLAGTCYNFYQSTPKKLAGENYFLHSGQLMFKSLFVIYTRWTTTNFLTLRICFLHDI
uniref:Uncharacterized protein n=1 Tax=Lactuca sativa TaxID=4236 RepID=A0A9R1W663_LACSA|nr:hypothetical protein LSAT_V11C300126460 [Lactuca sativa]